MEIYVSVIEEELFGDTITKIVYVGINFKKAKQKILEDDDIGYIETWVDGDYISQIQIK